MSTVQEIAHQSSRAVKKAACGVKKRPYATAGYILLGLGAFSLVMMWPEIQRYIKMERM